MPEAPTIEPVSAAAGELLIDLADRVIVAGLHRDRPVVPDSAELPVDLLRPLGAFVTLTVRGELNGCIGSIESDEPLGATVARHAWSAAFSDPRLPPLHRRDYAHLGIEISILSPTSAIPADSLAELSAALRPGVDGLLIDVGTSRAVFLPSVWDEVPTPDTFVRQLVRKAGLAFEPWPARLRACRFTVQKIGRGDVACGGG